MECAWFGVCALGCGGCVVELYKMVLCAPLEFFVRFDGKRRGKTNLTMLASCER